MTRLSDTDFLQVIAHTPLVSIDLIVRNAAGEVLLGKRENRPAQGAWFVPGGRIYKDERLAEAIARIVRTELGLPMDGLTAAFYGLYEHLYDDNVFGKTGVSTHYVVLAHSVDLPDGTTVTLDPQHSEYRWFSEADLLQDPAVHTYTRQYFARS